MRIDRLDLTRYGRFSNARLPFPKPEDGPDLHIIFGPNEAGKSTLFSAWLDLLYGIPKRSGYGFLHGGPQMRIAAALSDGDTVHEVVRMKRDSASLQDAFGANLPETVLQSLLGNLSRDGYRAMFSLDDETLEQGGDSILASNGDLGEMLFSASAGLSQLTPQLESLRARLDAYHKPGGRKGTFRDDKARLQELERQRKELDTSASTLQRLLRDVSAANRAWQTASQAEDAKAAELRVVQAVVNMLPARTRLAALEAQLSSMTHLPDLTEAHQTRFAQLDSETTALIARIQDRTARVSGLNERLQGLKLDPDAISQTEAIYAADELRSAYIEALRDLPRRRDEVAEAARKIDQTLAALGQPDANPASLLIDTAHLSHLRGLIAQHSGIQTALQQAKTEAARAKDHLDAERARLGDPGPEHEQTALAQLMIRIGQADPIASLREAQRDRDTAALRLQQALAGLTPWRGDPAALSALPVPADWQIEKWETEAEAIRQAVADAERGLAQAQTALDAAQVTAETGAFGITLADAAAMRQRREAAWASHRAQLTQDSANHFEAAMREDDRISGLIADAVTAEHRQSELRALQTALKAAQNAVAAAHDSRDRHLAAISDAATALGLADAPLATLENWLENRRSVLQIADELAAAELALTRAIQARDATTATLQAALARDDTADFEILRADALARLEASDRRQDIRRTLSALAQEAAKRDQALRQAQLAAQSWNDDWCAATQETLLNEASALEAGGLLDLTDRLGREVAEHAGLADRSRKMQANLDAFTSASENVITTLGLPSTTAWSDVLVRLSNAQEARKSAQRLQAEQDEEARLLAEDQAKLASASAALTALSAELACSEDQQLRDHIAAARKATDLRAVAASLREDLAGQPVPEAEVDPEALKAREATISRELESLRAETQSCFHALQEAKRQVAEVGGDDAVARIEAERANLKAAMADEVRRHLADRMGLVALEHGLRRYRDEHRSGMLKRASDAFRKLSRGAYTGLSAEPDGAKEILVATTASGLGKLANDMSKGTRFQLYLALRMAGYHELAQTRPTVPFIADDIMETFDDDRSAEAFRLLGDMARVGQVIYLTHHQHLCDIARQVCPGARVTDLREV